MSAPFRTSLRDTFLVARFEIVRAVRTWQALAVVALYLVATAGATRIFVSVIGAIEGVLADQLGVPRTDTPGAMMDRLLRSDDFRSLIGAMVGDDGLVDAVLAWPVLAIFHLWLGIVLMPFLATFSSAESVSGDLRSRALRFELLRTGRMELVFGRFFGQAALVFVASVLAVASTWTVTMLYMTGVAPVELFGALVYISLRAWAFGLPYIGIGLACSQVTASPAWARVLAIVAASGTWVLFGVAQWGQQRGYGIVADLLVQILPQGWIRALWEPGIAWLGASAVFLALGLSATAAGYAVFSRRDV